VIGVEGRGADRRLELPLEIAVADLEPVGVIGKTVAVGVDRWHHGQDSDVVSGYLSDGG
jgi:hypothetical protein